MGRRQKLIALSFDDGPAEATPAILDVLREHDARATFFVVGREIPSREGILERMIGEGNEIGNHTYSHAELGELSPEEIENELRATSDIIEKTVLLRPSLMRPPYGRGALQAARVARRLGMATVLWSVNTRDWDNRSAEEITRTALSAAEPGAVVVFHDGGGDRRPTAEAVSTIVPTLKEQGFRLVTISGLFEERPRSKRKVIPRKSVEAVGPGGGCGESYAR